MTDPIELFLDTAEQARARQIDTAPAALATTDGRGRASVRIVLVRHVDARGFVFYTNFESRKARELAEHPFAALCFYWPGLDVQVRVEGRVERVSDAESDAYFATRPRGSQLGAWASDQSRTLPSREHLLDRFREAERRFAGEDVPRPPFWGGYRVVPEQVEFWYGREDRLHDRVLYTREGEQWRVERLYP